MTTDTKDRPLHKKFSVDLRKAMRSRLVERDEEIEIFILALIARTHAFFLGEPGIAKSMLVEVGHDLIDGLTEEDYFHILFMKSTTREDVFGPLDLQRLKDGHYRYMPEGFLPVAKFVFGDEFWKANGAIQNALLWATNERLYRNDGQVITIPLHSMFIASNEMPENDELLAIYDRFPLRRVVKRISEPGNFVSMLKIASGEKPVLKKVIHWDDVEEAHRQVRDVVVPEAVLDALSDVKEQLKAESIFPSDRRFGQAIDIVKAAAWLDGETEADVEHLHPLRHVLWSDPNNGEPEKVEEKLLTISNPIDIRIGQIRAGLAGLSAAIDQVINDGGDDDQKERAASEIYEKVDAAKVELAEIGEELRSSKKRTIKLDPAIDQVMSLTERLLVKVFKTSPESVKKGLAQFRMEMTGEGEEDGEEE